MRLGLRLPLLLAVLVLGMWLLWPTQDSGRHALDTADPRRAVTASDLLGSHAPSAAGPGLAARPTPGATSSAAGALEDCTLTITLKE